MPRTAFRCRREAHLNNLAVGKLDPNQVAVYSVVRRHDDEVLRPDRMSHEDESEDES